MTFALRCRLLRARRRSGAVLLAMVCTRAARAQTGYYNLDSGRPTRVEDAISTPRGELEVQVLPIRLESLGDGTQRFRVEPKVAYGILPLTEIELRVPLLYTRSPNASPTTGIASAGVGALHAFNAETSWPALALAAEAVLPVGSMSATTVSYSVKGLLTKTLPFARFHLNAGGGTWSIRPPPAPTFGGTLCGNAPGVPPCLIPDVPCSVAPMSVTEGPSFACMPAASVGTTSAAGSSPTSGAHWTASLGIDHTFPLASALVIADIVVDRYDGLYLLDDWTTELGFRSQVAPQLVFDVGLARRFAGSTQSTSFTVGATYSLPLLRSR